MELVPEWVGIGREMIYKWSKEGSEGWLREETCGSERWLVKTRQDKCVERRELVSE